MSNNKLLLVVMLAVVFLCPRSASADSEAPPEDYKVLSPNNEYVLVLLVPDRDRDWYTEDKTLRKHYPTSGLYRNDGSNESLWTMDWHSYEAYLSSDGKHAVRMGPWPRLWNDKDIELDGPALKQLAIAFYEEGRLLKEYTIGDLIKDPKKLPPHTISHFQWKKDIQFDDKENRIKLMTFDGQQFVLDITTGEMIRE